MMTKKRSILIVDDDNEVLDTLCDLFPKDLFEVHYAKNATMAFDCILNNFIDLLITDIRMEHANGGIELLRLINNLPVDDRPVSIIMSGETDLSPDEATKYNVSRFFVKPFNTQDLIKEAKLVISRF